MELDRPLMGLSAPEPLHLSLEEEVEEEEEEEEEEKEEEAPP